MAKVSPEIDIPPPEDPPERPKTPGSSPQTLVNRVSQHSKNGLTSVAAVRDGLAGVAQNSATAVRDGVTGAAHTSVTSVRGGLGTFVKKTTSVGLPQHLIDFYDGLVEEHTRVLRKHIGRAAVLTRPDFEPKFPDDSDMQVEMEATLTYFREPRKLFIVYMRDRNPLKHTMEDIPCVQLGDIKEQARKIFKEGVKDVQGPDIWPLMSRDVAEAIAACETHSLFGYGADGKPIPTPWWKRVLTSLRIWLPQKSGVFIEVLLENVGPSTAYLVARGDYFAQMLWFLSVWAIVAVIVNMQPHKMSDSTKDHVGFEVFKVGLVIWGIVVSIAGRKRSAIGLPTDDLRKAAMKKLMANVLLEHPSGHEAHTPRIKIMFEMFKGSVLALLLIAVVMFTLFLVATLSVYVVYEWGECLKLECRDPQVKHGFWGWCAEVGLDIMLAILFELFFGISSGLSRWIAEHREFQILLHYQFEIEMFSIVLSAIERIGTFGILAFVFTPQWEEPSPAFAKGLKVDISRDCSDLMFKNSDIFCFQRKLPLQSRRHVFQKSFKGPFCVAPFVGIIIKSLVPYVAMKLDESANQYKCKRCPCCDTFCDGFFHLLALIFTRDGGQVGCCKYVSRGWPFEEIKLVQADAPCTQSSLRSAAQVDSKVEQQPLTDAGCEKTETTITVDDVKDIKDEKTNGEHEKTNGDPPAETNGEHEKKSKDDKESQNQMESIEEALAQSTRKPWEPMSELLEMKLSFLWIMFFGPIMPVGIIPTLAARIIESRTDIVKMLFVRRRVWPDTDALMHFTQITFNGAVVFGSIGWSIGLSCMTYNDDLYKWSEAAHAGVSVGVTLWVLMSLGSMMRTPKIEVLEIEKIGAKPAEVQNPP